jgi:hypothetical protein
MAKKKNEVNETVVATLEVVPPVSATAVAVVETVPAANIVAPLIREPLMHEWGWTDYVLQHLQEDEMFEGAPTQAGLLRIFETVMKAEIVDIKHEVLQCPNPQNMGRAVVSCELSFLAGTPHRIKRVSECADCYAGNTPTPFSNHPVATACTLALGRALRKALRLRQGVHTREEMTSVSGTVIESVRQIESTSGPLADKSQIVVIQNLCKKMGLEANKLVGLDSEYPEFTSLENLSYNTAGLILQNLHAYRENKMEIPERLKVVN